GRGVFLLDRVTAPEPEKLLHRHFPGSNGETPIDPTLVTLLTLAHPEHTPCGHNHHRLSLAVDVPLPLSSRLAARQFPVDLLEPGIGLPLSQKPPREAVDTSVRVVPVETHQPRNEVLPFNWR